MFNLTGQIDKFMAFYHTVCNVESAHHHIHLAHISTFLLRASGVICVRPFWTIGNSVCVAMIWLDHSFAKSVKN